MRICIAIGLLSVFLLSSCASGNGYREDFAAAHDRMWIGPQFWANRLQDWQIKDNRLECLEARQKKPYRTVHLLGCSVAEENGDIEISFKTGLISAGEVSEKALTGVLTGAGGGLDYRAASVVHSSPGPGGGIIAGINSKGVAIISDFTVKGVPVLAQGQAPKGPLPAEVLLTLKINTTGGVRNMLLIARDASDDSIISRAAHENIPASKLAGNIALVSHPGTGKKTGRFWFDDIRIKGAKGHNDRSCGPVICSQHTLSDHVLNLTAQMMPISEQGNLTVSLEINESKRWKEVSKVQISRPAYIAEFQVDNWYYKHDVSYRVKYNLATQSGKPVTHYFEGTIRHNPAEKDTITVAAFTGNHNNARGVESGYYKWDENLWFPHTDMTSNVLKQKPDILFFSGDQIYESQSPTGAERNNADYLYKWYFWCWAYRDLAKDIPCICIPDDHDVFQGNLWGQGGRKAKRQGDGGYVMSAEFVKLVEATQTSHLPDPYDPTPVKQGIGVYYTAVNYGDISFAVLEDRKFKTGEKSEETKSGNPDKLVLLGSRQLQFLRDWSADYHGNIQMKVALSQTVFCCQHTSWGGNLTKKNKPSVDFDSNGWPVRGRNEALDAIRRGFGFMIGGDQHLATIIHHGTDSFNDSGWSFCVPSVANFYPRAWRPAQPGGHHTEGMPDYTGEYLDGFGNKITVWAAANPGPTTGKEPAILHDKSPGYGIVHFKKSDRQITMECWPRYADPADPTTGRQYPGWPKTITQEDNYSREAVETLPLLKISGNLKNPVIQVIDESNDEIIYTLRIKGDTYKPRVFKAGSYTIKVGKQGTAKMQVLKSIKSLPLTSNEEIEIVF